MKCEDVIQCSIDRWYPKFKKDTFLTYLIKISDDFLKYLNEDGIIVPDFQDDDVPDFHKEVFREIKAVLRKLDNVAFVKLNWSSPKDARWILPNSNLQCTSADDIYILLKSSDRIAHDLTQPYKDCEDAPTNPQTQYVLAVRRWEDFSSSYEFRCFVKERTLIGVCQRDISAHWPYVKDQRKEILHHINSFFEEKIQNRFPLPDFVFDVVRYNEEKIKIVDFNPFGPTTDSLLFTWTELTSSESLENLPEDVSAVADAYLPDENQESGSVFRFVKQSMAMQSTSYRLNNFPVDAVVDPQEFYKAMNTENFGSDTDSESGGE